MKSRAVLQTRSSSIVDIPELTPTILDELQARASEWAEHVKNEQIESQYPAQLNEAFDRAIAQYRSGRATQPESWRGLLNSMTVKLIGLTMEGLLERVNSQSTLDQFKSRAGCASSIVFQSVTMLDPGPLLTDEEISAFRDFLDAEFRQLRATASERARRAAPNLGVNGDLLLLAIPKKRGRKRRFTPEQLDTARKMKNGAKSNQEIAKTLYKTNTPNSAQRRSVPTVLKYHFGSKK